MMAPRTGVRSRANENGVDKEKRGKTDGKNVNHVCFKLKKEGVRVVRAVREIVGSESKSWFGRRRKGKDARTRWREMEDGGKVKVKVKMKKKAPQQPNRRL